MKNTIKVLGIISLALVIGFSVLGCKKDEDEGGGGLSLLTPANASAAPKFTTLDAGAKAVTTKKQAEDLFGAISVSIFYPVQSAVEDAMDDAFKKAYGGKSIDDWEAEQYAGGKTSASYSVSGINDTTTLPNDITTITAGKITGSFKGNGSWSNLSSTASYNQSGSESGSITVDISEGYVGGYSAKVAGVVKTEWSNSGSSKWTWKEAEDYFDESGSNSGTWKTSYTLSVSDGTYGAKFRFSIAEKGSGSDSSTTDRAASNSDKTERKCSDIEVYGNDDVKILTLRVDYHDLSSYLIRGGSH